MPRMCRVPGCSYKRENSSRRGLHELPKNEAVRRKILKDLGFPDDFVISCKQFHICSAHFSDDSFTWKGKKSLIAEPTVDNTKLMQVKQEEEDGRIILASQIKSEIEENSENEFVYQPTNFLEGELKKIKIRSYCQFCLNEQHELCSKIHVNEDLKQNFLDLTGKMLDTSTFCDFICCNPCFQQFLDAIEYRKSLLKNQKVLENLYNSSSQDVKENPLADLIKVEPESFEDKENEAVTPQCFKCNEVLNDRHFCPRSRKEKFPKEKHQKVIYSDKTSKIPITCDKCDKKFTKRGSFVAHFRQNHATDSESEVCHQCGKIFRSRKHLMIHMFTHQEKQFKCDQCPQAFKHPSNLRRHFLAHSNTKPYPCQLCSRAYTQKANLTIHIKSFHNQRYKCDSCGKTYNDRQLLKKHIIRHSYNPNLLRPKKKNEMYNCIVPGCEYRSSLRRAIGVHLEKIHNMKFDQFDTTCLECLHVSANPGTHLIHMKTHSCKFVCDLCRQKFKTEESRQAHINKVHRDEEERPFVCDFPDCGAKFKRAAHLQSHRSYIHFAERKFACSLCEMTFHYQHGYKVHMRIHTDSKPYSCWMCDFKCRVSSGLQLHMKLSHNETRFYSCKFCPQKFKLYSELTQHEKSH